MTLQALPTQPVAWRPTAGYYLAAVNEVSPAEAVRVSNEAIDEYWKGFWEQCDALMLLEKPTPPRPSRWTRRRKRQSASTAAGSIDAGAQGRGAAHRAATAAEDGLLDGAED